MAQYVSDQDPDFILTLMLAGTSTSTENGGHERTSAYILLRGAMSCQLTITGTSHTLTPAMTLATRSIPVQQYEHVAAE